MNAYYRRRREGMFLATIAEIGSPPNVTDIDVLNVCHQLGEHGLLEWQPVRAVGHPGISSGTGRINAHGIDVVEGVASTGISINLNSSQNISVNSSSNVAISGSNTQANVITIQDLVSGIDHSDAPDSDKEEAKGLLRRFLDHPLVATIASGAFGS